MSDDLYQVWRDDCLIEAAARGDLLELEGDPAAGPLAALSMLADGGPLPRFDVDAPALVDSRNSQRYAVRSLAVAVTVVATLSTSGVAAVVTGDPLRPAKAVWHQIQDHTGLRSDSPRADSGAALGPAVAPQDSDASKPADASVARRRAPTDGLVAQAPAGLPDESTGERSTAWHPAQSSTAEDQAAEDSTSTNAQDDPQSADEQDQSQDPAEPTGPAEQEPGDDAGSQPAPEEQPTPDSQSDDGGLEDVVPPGTPGGLQDGGTLEPLPTQRTLPEDGADDDQTLGETSPQPLSGTDQDTLQGTAPATGDDANTDDSADGSTDTSTSAPPASPAP